jgi:AcrR family transcriptional regulator
VNSDSDSEPGRQTLRERLREATSREILAAAERVFAEEGLERASMAQIAEQAGVAVGTLYNRFKDREALLEALLSERRQELLDKLDARIASHSKAPFREQLVGFLTTLFAHFAEHRAFLRLVFARETGRKDKREQMSRALLDRLEGILKRGQREKLLRRDPDHSFTVFLMSAAKGVLQRDYYGLSSVEPVPAAEALVTLFLEGAGR